MCAIVESSVKGNPTEVLIADVTKATVIYFWKVTRQEVIMPKSGFFAKTFLANIALESVAVANFLVSVAGKLTSLLKESVTVFTFPGPGTILFSMNPEDVRILEKLRTSGTFDRTDNHIFFPLFSFIRNVTNSLVRHK